MKAPSSSVLRKYLSVMNKSKKKYITAESLSREVGVYPDIIVDNLEYFEPMLKMDPDYNLKDLIPQIEEYLNSKETNKKPIINPEYVVSKKTLGEYESVNDFIYKKMSIGGMLDFNAVLTDKDLRVLKKLIVEELNNRKKR